MTTKLIGVREFRQNIASLYKKARKNNWRYIVLSRNKPIFRIEALGEEDATIERLAYEIEEAREDVKKGKVQEMEEVFSELGL